MITKKAYAKINIGLDIVSRRSDGYHNIDTIMQTVSLADEISMEKSEGINIVCTDPTIPLNLSNTCYKAAVLFFKKADINSTTTGVTIYITKNIPSRAGLGGGSSDAATVLLLLNKLYCTEFGTSVLRELALEVGSDVPFFIEGGTKRAYGRGEQLTSLPLFENKYLVIVMPSETVDTAYAYSLYSKSKNVIHPNMDNIEKAVCNGDLNRLKRQIGNTFERLLFSVKPAIEKARHDILKTGAIVSAMTGSGAAVFGIYASKEAAVTAHAALADYYESHLVKTVGGKA